MSLRHAVIGVNAVIFESHLPGLRLPGAELVAVCGLNAERGQRRAVELGCPFYTDYRAMLAEARPDVAVILTPHPAHAAMAIDCLRVGCHVLVEKPMAVAVSEADAMIAEARGAGRLLAVSYQMRHRPEVRAARALLRRGELGQVQRVDLTATWLRPAAYYRSAPWRGTWAGEAGGLLINQAIHHLDLLCHLLGSPRRLTAWARTQRHAIEVEDTVQAMVEWPDGAWGGIHLSTAEAGQPERLEIAGTHGQLRIARGRLEVQSFEPDVPTHLATSYDFSQPALRPRDAPLEPGEANHAAIYANLHAAIRTGAPLTADGPEARASLELANALTLSAHTHSEVTFPVDRAAYDTLLTRLRAVSVTQASA